MSNKGESLLFFAAGVAVTLLATAFVEKKKVEKERAHGELSENPID